MRNCNKGVDTCSFLKPDETGKVQRYGYTYSLSKSRYDAVMYVKYYKKVFVYKTGLREEIEAPEEVGDTDILDVSWSYKAKVPLVKLLGVFNKGGRSAFAMGIVLEVTWVIREFLNENVETAIETCIDYSEDKELRTKFEEFKKNNGCISKTGELLFKRKENIEYLVILLRDGIVRKFSSVAGMLDDLGIGGWFYDA